MRVEEIGERLIGATPDIESNYDYLLAESDFNHFEISRLSVNEPEIYLINTDDGSRKCIARGFLDGNFSFSREKKVCYLV